MVKNKELVENKELVLAESLSKQPLLVEIPFLVETYAIDQSKGDKTKSKARGFFGDLGPQTANSSRNGLEVSLFTALDQKTTAVTPLGGFSRPDFPVDPISGV